MLHAVMVPVVSKQWKQEPRGYTIMCMACSKIQHNFIILQIYIYITNQCPESETENKKDERKKKKKVLFFFYKCDDTYYALYRHSLLLAKRRKICHLIREGTTAPYTQCVQGMPKYVTSFPQQVDMTPREMSRYVLAVKCRLQWLEQPI